MRAYLQLRKRVLASGRVFGLSGKDFGCRNECARVLKGVGSPEARVVGVWFFPVVSLARGGLDGIAWECVVAAHGGIGGLWD